MNRQEALALARTKWGKNGHAEEGRDLSSPARRASSRDALARLKAEEPSRPDIDAWPGEATVAAFRAAMTQWRDAHKAWRKKKDKASGGAYYYRCTVGTLDPIAGLVMFHVMGTGDTWEEAFAKAGVPSGLTPGGTCKRQ